jgi:hypothetical protein
MGALDRGGSGVFREACLCDDKRSLFGIDLASRSVRLFVGARKAILIRADALRARREAARGPRLASRAETRWFSRIARKAGRRAQLWSGNQKDFTRRFHVVAKGIAELPNDTVMDGEIVALYERADRRSIFSRASAMPTL